VIGASLRRSSGIAIVTLFFSVMTHASPGGCSDWTRRVGALPSTARAELERYGAYADGEWVLFSKKLVSACEQRASFSRYTGNVIRGIAPAAADVAVVAANRKRFVQALAEIWPTRGRRFPGEDGAFREQLTVLLTTRELDACSTRPLLEKILRGDGVTGELTYVLMSRPDAALRAMIEPHAAPKRDVTNANIYAVAILQTLGDDVATELHALMSSRLTATQRAVVQVLEEKLQRHAKPSWDDVVDLETE
jgi:hypothetical protein